MLNYVGTVVTTTDASGRKGRSITNGLGQLVRVDEPVATGGTADAAAKRGGTLTLARPDEPLSLDPVIPSDNGSIYALAQICESLILADDSGKRLVPGLAESWETSTDGLSVIYKLRDGVKWHGIPDFVFVLYDITHSLAGIAVCYGLLVAWKARPEATELADAAAAAQVLRMSPPEARPVPADLVRGADLRTLYVSSRVGDPPPEYPRRAGMARKRPLRAST